MPSEWLTTDELEYTLDQDLENLFDYDANLITAVTYQSVDSTESGYAFDPETGIHTISTTDVSLSAVKGTLAKVDSATGRHETGRWRFLIRDSDLGSVTPKVSDRIAEGTELYEIEEAQRAILGRVWVLVVRKH